MNYLDIYTRAREQVESAVKIKPLRLFSTALYPNTHTAQSINAAVIQQVYYTLLSSLIIGIFINYKYLHMIISSSSSSSSSTNIYRLSLLSSHDRNHYHITTVHSHCSTASSLINMASVTFWLSGRFVSSGGWSNVMGEGRICSKWMLLRYSHTETHKNIFHLFTSFGILFAANFRRIVKRKAERLKQCRGCAYDMRWYDYP